MQFETPSDLFLKQLTHYPPQAQAWVKGSTQHPNLSGIVNFYHTPYGGILIEAEIFGLPNIETTDSSNFYGMHIHEFGDCSNQFQNTGNHYNPSHVSHPKHSGDLPPLLGNQGYAYTIFYDKRFTIEEIIGKSMVVHSQRDDFTTQPAGDSGTKIGCGVIQPFS